jgi:hypothetical protein
MNALSGHDEYPNTCSARYNTVNTFDGVEVPLYSNCPFVLSKDCSESRLFTISLRSAHHQTAEPQPIKVSGKGQKQILDIALNVPGNKRHFQFYYTTKTSESNIHSASYYRYETSTSSDEEPLKAFVKIVGGSEDGKYMPAENKNSFESLSETVTKYPGQEYWSIFRVSPRVLIFKSPILGITVRYDMKSTDVSLTSTPWSSKVCGMCGDMNGESTDEFKTPSGKVAKDSKTFYFSNSLYSDKEGDKYDSNEVPVCSVGSGRNIPSRSSIESSTYFNEYRPSEIDSEIPKPDSEIKSWTSVQSECKIEKRPVIRDLTSDEHEPLICVSRGSENMIQACSSECSYSVPKTTKVELMCVRKERAYELGLSKTLRQLGEHFENPSLVAEDLKELLENGKFMTEKVTKYYYANEDSKCYY